MEQQTILKELESFTGTEHYYRHFTGIKYTDGIQFLAGKCKAFWLIDVIASYQHKFQQSCEFQIWTIKVNKDKTAVVTMKEDTGKPNLVRQEIKYTDFPLKELEVYCIRGVILLKSEY